MMGIHTFLSDNEADFDPDDTEKIEPLFILAQTLGVVVLVGPDGKHHEVRRGTMAYRVMKSHGYKELES